MATVRVSLIVGVLVRYASTLAIPELLVFKMAVAFPPDGVIIIADVPPDHVPIDVANVTFEVVDGTFTLMAKVSLIAMAVGSGLPGIMTAFRVC
jgi:hypothetical protein